MMTTKQIEALKLALEKVQEFKARWWKVPPFGNKVNKATREAITNAHSPIFELENTIREALAEQPAQQQEPVACDGDFPEGFDASLGIPAQALRAANAIMFDVINKREWDVPCTAQHLLTFVKKYTSPQPSKPWVGLTEDEKRQLFEYEDYDGWLDYINAIEAKLREKNA